MAEDASTTAAAETQSRSRRTAIGFGLALVVVAIYALSLVGVHLLAKSTPLPAVDLSKFESEDTVVQVKLQELKTVANRLTVNVQVYPKNSLFDKKFGVLTADAAVRLYPDNDLGDLIYPAGKNPGQVATTIQADGDPANWPFDSYKTEPIAATVFTGTGATRETASAYVGVSGQLDGWDATVTRVHDSEDGSDASVQNDVIITLNRSKGSLIFDFGICLVLISLPVLALVVAIPMAMGRTSFIPPFMAWSAAMLFATVPLRNILPGSPPFGSWIDQAVVLWVLIALIIAMMLFLYAWWRSRDRKTPTKS
jgi:hypothetical protein